MPSQDLEFDLFEFLLMAWKRKSFIFLMTISSMLLVGTICILSPKTYKAEAIIEIGLMPNISSESEASLEFLEKPKLLAMKVKDVHRIKACSQLDLAEEECLKVDVQTPRELQVVKMGVRDRDPGRAVKLLNILNGLILDDHDKRYSYIRKSKENEIARNKIEIGAFKKSRSHIHKNLKISKVEVENKIQRKNLKIATLHQQKQYAASQLEVVHEGKSLLREHLADSSERIVELMKEKSQLNLQAKKPEFALSAIYFTNEIQANQKYRNGMAWQLTSTLKKEALGLQSKIESYDMSVKEAELAIHDIGLHSQNQELEAWKQIDVIEKEIEKKKLAIKDLEHQLSHMRTTTVLKPPSYLKRPVSPKTKRNTLLAGLAALLGGIFLVSFLDMIKQKKNASSQTLGGHLPPISKSTTLDLRSPSRKGVPLHSASK